MKAAIVRGSNFLQMYDALQRALPYFGVRLTAHVHNGDQFLVLSKRRELTDAEIDALWRKDVSENGRAQ